MAVGKASEEDEAEVAYGWVDESDQLSERQLQTADECNNGQSQADNGIGAAGLQWELVGDGPQHGGCGGVNAQKGNN